MKKDPANRALKRIKEMSKAWLHEGGDRKKKIDFRITLLLGSAIAGRCAEIIEEEMKKK